MGSFFDWHRLTTFPLALLAAGLVLVTGIRLLRRPDGQGAPAADIAEDELAESESSWIEWRGSTAPVLVETGAAQ